MQRKRGVAAGGGNKEEESPSGTLKDQCDTTGHQPYVFVLLCFCVSSLSSLCGVVLRTPLHLHFIFIVPFCLALAPFACAVFAYI